MAQPGVAPLQAKRLREAPPASWWHQVRHDRETKRLPRLRPRRRRGTPGCYCCTRRDQGQRSIAVRGLRVQFPWSWRSTVLDPRPSTRLSIWQATHGDNRADRQRHADRPQLRANFDVCRDWARDDASDVSGRRQAPLTRRPHLKGLWRHSASSSPCAPLEHVRPH